MMRFVSDCGKSPSLAFFRSKPEKRGFRFSPNFVARFANSLYLLLICAICVTCIVLPLACDDDDDDDADDDTPADDDTDNPTIGACLCCFTTQGEVWGWCWNVGFADECQSGCELNYDEEHLAGALFFEDAACLDFDITDTCRAQY